jgi:hypothetical protein
VIWDVVSLTLDCAICKIENPWLVLNDSKYSTYARGKWKNL